VDYHLRGQLHRLFDQWSTEYGPICGYHYFRAKHADSNHQGHNYLRVIVTDPAEARRVLQLNPTKSRLLQVSVVLGEGVIGMEDKAEWSRQRTILKPAVTTENIREVIFPVIKTQVSNLMTTLSSLSVDPATGLPRSLEAHHQLLLFAFAVIGTAMLGEEPAFLADRIPLLNDAFTTTIETETFDSLKKGAAIFLDQKYIDAGAAIDDFVEETVHRYRSQNGCPVANPNAFVSLILATDKDGKEVFDHKVQRDQITSFLIAG